MHVESGNRTQVWCSPGLVLSRLVLSRSGAIQVSCCQGLVLSRLVLSRSGAVQVWCYPGLVLSRSGAVQVWCSPGLVLSRSGAVQVWCSPRLVLSRVVLSRSGAVQADALMPGQRVANKQREFSNENKWLRNTDLLWVFGMLGTNRHRFFMLGRATSPSERQ